MLPEVAVEVTVVIVVVFGGRLPRPYWGALHPGVILDQVVRSVAANNNCGDWVDGYDPEQALPTNNVNGKFDRVESHCTERGGRLIPMMYLDDGYY